ncbi:MAG: hypothetical protein RLW61_03470 [Gammaproteobacteria bacterium]
MKFTIDDTCANLARLRRCEGAFFSANSGEFGPFMLELREVSASRFISAMHDESMAITNAWLRRHGLWGDYERALDIVGTTGLRARRDSQSRGRNDGEVFQDTLRVLCWHAHAGNDCFVSPWGKSHLEGVTRVALADLFGTRIVSFEELTPLLRPRQENARQGTT